MEEAATFHCTYVTHLHHDKFQSLILELCIICYVKLWLFTVLRDPYNS